MWNPTSSHTRTPRFEFEKVEGHNELGPLPQQLLDQMCLNCTIFEAKSPSCFRENRDKPGITLLENQGRATPFVLKDTTEELFAARYVAKTSQMQIIVVQEKPSSTTAPRLNDGKPVIVVPVGDAKLRTHGGRNRWFVWHPQFDVADYNLNSLYVEKIVAGSLISLSFSNNSTLQMEMPQTTDKPFGSPLRSQLTDTDDEAMEDIDYEPTGDQETATWRPGANSSSNKSSARPYRVCRSTKITTYSGNDAETLPIRNSSCRQPAPAAACSSRFMANAIPPPRTNLLRGRMSLPGIGITAHTVQPPIQPQAITTLNPPDNHAYFSFPRSTEDPDPYRKPLNDVSSAIELFEIAWANEIIDDETILKVIFHGTEYRLRKDLPRNFQRMIQGINDAGIGGDAVVVKV